MLTLINYSLAACLNEHTRYFFVLSVVGEKVSLSLLHVASAPSFFRHFCLFLPFLFFGHTANFAALRHVIVRRPENELKSQWSLYSSVNTRVYLPGDRELSKRSVCAMISQTNKEGRGKKKKKLYRLYFFFFLYLPTIHCNSYLIILFVSSIEVATIFLFDRRNDKTRN